VSQAGQEPDASILVDRPERDLRTPRNFKWGIVPPEVVPAWVAETDFALDPAVEEALHLAISRGEVGYTAPRSAELARSTAAFLERRFGWSPDPGRIVATGDVMAGILLALDTVCPPGPVVVPTPAYPPFLDIVPLARRELVTVPLDPDAATATLDLDGIDAAFGGGAKTMILCHPHNPWGRDFTVDELTALRDVVDRHGARVISDEVHAPLVLTGSRHVPYASIDGAGAHTVTLVSASKAWNIPGLKCAQLIAATTAEADRLAGVPVVSNHGVSPLGVAANIAAYDGDDGWLEAVLDRLTRNAAAFRAALAESAPAARVRPLEATYLQWVDARAYGADPAIAARRRGRVMVMDGKAFGPGGAGHVRVNLGTLEERVREIATRLGRAWTQ
jgi:cystathionine beta-lyase